MPLAMTAMRSSGWKRRSGPSVPSLPAVLGPRSGLQHDVQFIAIATDDRTARLWRTPTPVEGLLERLALWVRVVTMELDEFGAPRSLYLDTWRKARERLDSLCGPPDRPQESETTVSPAR
jgi:hypothetical protein